MTARGPTASARSPAADLFQDYLTTALAHDEVITEVRLPGARGLRLRLREVHPPRRGLGDGRRVRARQAGADGTCEDVRIGLTHMGSTPLRASRGRGGAARRALDDELDRRRRRAGGRGHRAAGRPERHARLQAPPGARAHAPGARGGRRASDASTAPQPYARRWRASATSPTGASPPRSTSRPTLEQPLLLEGEAGVGKTEVAKALAGATGARLIRLQCHEGIDLHHALYDWDYPRQLLHLRAGAARSRSTRSASCCAARCSRRSRRPSRWCC